MRRRQRWFILAAIAIGLALPATVLADAPTATALTPTTLEDQLVTVHLAGDDADGDALTFSIASIPTNGLLGTIYNLSCDTTPPSHCTADVDYTPGPDYAGSDSFTYMSNDGVTNSSAASVDITITGVNDAPSFTDGGGKTVLEDSGAASYTTWASSISRGGGADETGQTVTFSAGNLSNAGLFSVAPAVSAGGTLTFTPAANANGSSTVDITAQDNGGTSNGGQNTSTIHTITITVTAVNDAPSFTAGGDQTVNEDSGSSNFIGWATSPSAGPANEVGQTLSYVVSSNNHPEFFSAGPTVATNGTLSFTTASNAFGVATVGVKIQDSGGTSNGGLNQSAEQTFTITVTAVNDHPTPQNDFPTIPENAPATAVAVLTNDNTNNPDGAEVLTITSVNTTGTAGQVVITGGGTGLTYQPPAGFTGSDLFTYTVQDPGLLSGTATVLVTVGKDVTGPVVTAPVESIRTGVTMGTTIQVNLTWTGSDAGVGVAKYSLQQSVDGGSYTTITLATNLTTSVNRFETVGHSYHYRVRATDKNGNTGGYKYASTFTDLRYEDSSPYVHYTGTWGTSSSTTYSGGTMHYAGTAGKAVTFTSVGRDFAIVGPRSTTRGTFQVFVDGVLNATVSEQRSSAITKQVLWAIHFTTSTSHQIKIVVVGPARIDLDCILVLR